MGDSVIKPGGKDLHCTECTNLLATISQDGVLAQTIQQRVLARLRGCDMCRESTQLHSAARDADFDLGFAQRCNYPPSPRLKAFLEANRVAHKNLGNFLLGLHQIDQPPSRDTLQPDAQGTKRSRSQTPPPRALKRARNEVQRVGFDENVVFYDEDSKRDTGSFYRFGKNYEKGRHALPEGQEYLDTSGATVDIDFFYHQMTWDGYKCISQKAEGESAAECECDLLPEESKTENDDTGKIDGYLLQIEGSHVVENGEGFPGSPKAGETLLDQEVSTGSDNSSPIRMEERQAEDEGAVKCDNAQGTPQSECEQARKVDSEGDVGVASEDTVEGGADITATT